MTFEVINMTKKNNAYIYWQMTYKGKFRRTLYLIPVGIIVCILSPLFLGKFWYIYSIIITITLILQLIYTYKMMKIENQHTLADKENTNFQ